MKPGFLAPKGLLETKPAHGAPCNRCGLCCMASLCPLATALFKRELGPCPALEKDGATYACGLVAHPGSYAPMRTMALGTAAMREAAVTLVGAGDGCDARMNGEPRNEAFDSDLVRRVSKRRRETLRAQSTWGVADLRWSGR